MTQLLTIYNIVPELSASQMEALKHYAAQHGRCWKEALRNDWTYARLTGPLHALRNSHGPRWLATFHLHPAK